MVKDSPLTTIDKKHPRLALLLACVPAKAVA